MNVWMNEWMNEVVKYYKNDQLLNYTLSLVSRKETILMQFGRDS